MSQVMDLLKTTFMGGVIFLVPVVVAFVVIAKAFGIVVNVAQPLARWAPVAAAGGIVLVELLAVLLILLLCFLAGLLAGTRIARRFLRALETRFLDQVPAYSLIKGMTSSLVEDPEARRLAPVYVRFDDFAQIGLEVERLADKSVVVFFPDAPTAWSGSVRVVTPDRVTTIDATMLTALQNIQHLGREMGAVLEQGRPNV